MITRIPTEAEILALAENPAATYDDIVQLGIEPPISDANDAETIDSDTSTRCRGCQNCRYCRNCYKANNSSHCDDSAWMNLCHHVVNCHGADPGGGGGRAIKLYYCTNLHGCDRCIYTDNMTGAQNVIYGVTVSASVFNVLEAVILAHIAEEQALEDAGP